MKTLLLLTTSFPYGMGEDFLSTELSCVSGFDRVIVVPCSRKPGSEQTKNLPNGISCVPLERMPLGRSAYLGLAFRPCVQAELFRLLRQGKLNPTRAHELLYFMKNASEIFFAIKRAVPFRPGDSVVIYSYWLYDAAAAGAMLASFLRKRGAAVRQISRAHGFDIHEERSKNGYLPMRSFLFKNVEHIYACSEDGARTLRTAAGREADKVTRAYLGTEDCGLGKTAHVPLHLLSCSYLVPVKRIHLLIGALMQADFPVVWTHIGSGPLAEELRGLAAKLPPCVKAEFPGTMKNADVLAYYKTHEISAFVNVSSSEGVPVTVMEACSFGVPVVATDVGGTGELVRDGENGFLLPKDFSPEELLAALRKISGMENGEYRALCTASRKKWEENFSAERNYRKFYEELSET